MPKAQRRMYPMYNVNFHGVIQVKVISLKGKLIGQFEDPSPVISSFLSMKRLGVLLQPLDGILVHYRLPPSILSGYPQTNLLVPIYTPG